MLFSDVKVRMSGDATPLKGGVVDVESSTFQCSPALNRRDGETCLPTSALKRLATTWNKTHSRKIPLNVTRRGGRVANNQSVNATLWTRLRDAMKDHYKCSTEFCLVKKLPGLTPQTRKSLATYFRPEKPKSWDKKPTLWLDSFNIEDVMKQYEAAVPSFEFIGPVPIDFDEADGWGKCIVTELCKLDIPSMVKKGKTKIGIIFNLDPHDEPGSHWVCAFLDASARNAYYFDSYGYAPPKEIVRFLKRCKQQGCKHIYYNDIRHQRKGSECGMYCLFVIICLLRGRNFYDICKNVVDDDTMNAFRDVLFAEEKPRREAIEESLPRLCT